DLITTIARISINACRLGNVEALDTIAKFATFDAVNNITDSHGWSLLHIACYFNHPLVVEFLVSVLKIPIQIKNQSYHGWTPLLVAVNQNSFECVKYIIQSNPNAFHPPFEVINAPTLMVRLGRT